MKQQRKILTSLQPIFREIFKNKKLILKKDLSAENVKNWDSLNHLTLIVEIEKKYRCNFTVKEISELNNVGDFVNLLLKKKVKF